MAWVQETVGAKMSRRARVSCCKWGSEKISELTHRYVGASNGFKRRYVATDVYVTPGGGVPPLCLQHSPTHGRVHLQYTRSSTNKTDNFWHGDDD